MAKRNALRCVYEVAILRALRRGRITVRVAKICAYTWPYILSRRPQEQKWQHYATSRVNEAGVQRRQGNFFEARLALLDARKALHKSRLLRRQACV